MSKEYVDLCALKLQCAACEQEDNGKHISCRNNLESKWQQMMNDNSDRSFPKSIVFILHTNFGIDHVQKTNC